VAFGSAAGATAVDGLRDITFDNGDAYLVALASSRYNFAPVGDTGTFSVTATGQPGNQLEVIQYRNRFFLLNGVTADVSSTGTNSVIYLTATAAGNALTPRQMGMIPVIAAPFVTASASAFSQGVVGYYEYWTTEVAKITQDNAVLTLESAFNSNTGPTTIYVTSVGMAPIIQMPATLNPITTHWRVYRSPKKEKATDKKFPSGFMISEMAVSTATAGATASAANYIVDTSVLSTAASFPATANGVAPYANFFTPLGATAIGGAFASATAGTFAGQTKAQAWYGFNSFGGFAGSVKGITVEVGAKTLSGTTPMTVTIGKRALDGDFTTQQVVGGPSTINVPKTASKSANVTGTSTQVLTFGGPTDRWFSSDVASLVDSDFDSNFMVRVSFSRPSAQLFVDYIIASAHYGGPIDGTVQYPAIVYTFGDLVTQESKNMPPPNASTGDVFEDSLVLNDVSQPSFIRWSFPGDPESFPPSYFLDFETRENDQVRLVKVVNSSLVVALDASIWRINYLPSERDSSFDRGKAIAPISKAYGCVNPMCACTFSMDSKPEGLAFVSDSGIHITDGYSFDTLTDGLNWRGIISTTSTSAPICLINDRENQEILFYYRNDALGNETYMCLHLSYASEHRATNGGNFKISGPVHVRNFEPVGGGYASLESAWAVQRTSGATDVYLGYGGASASAGAGYVFRETGTNIPSNDSTMRWVSRRMYLAGWGNEFEGAEVYGYCGSYTGAPIISYTAQNTKTNDAGPVQVFQKSVTLAGQKLHKIEPRAMFEGMQITAQITASAFSQEAIVIEGEPFGVEDSGR